MTFGPRMRCWSLREAAAEPTVTPCPDASACVPVCRAGCELIAGTRINWGGRCGSRGHLTLGSLAETATCLKKIHLFDGCWFCPAPVTGHCCPHHMPQAINTPYSCCLKLGKAWTNPSPRAFLHVSPQWLPQLWGTGQLCAVRSPAGCTNG